MNKNDLAFAYFEIAEEESTNTDKQLENFYRYRPQWRWSWLPGMGELMETERCKQEFNYQALLSRPRDKGNNNAGNIRPRFDREPRKRDEDLGTCIPKGAFSPGERE